MLGDRGEGTIKKGLLRKPFFIVFHSCFTATPDFA
jgi:hypothetical protein